MNLRKIITAVYILLEFSFGEIHQYSCIETTPGIQFPGNIGKYQNSAGKLDCAIFCLDSEKLILSAELCEGRCGCYSELPNMADSIVSSNCIYIHTSTHTNDLNSNCFDIYKCYSRGNGVYNISINGNIREVFCDMDRGGWTVIQRRYDGSEDFMRSYEEYQLGFGTMDGEYWLGLDKIHNITNSGLYKVRFDLEDFNGEHAFAEYNYFHVSDSTDNYRLQISGYHGNAGDGMTYHSGCYFSAGSVDNDEKDSSCAISYNGGWWYKSCHYVNINGLYNGTNSKGVVWYHWHGYDYSLKSTSIKIKPRN